MTLKFSIVVPTLNRKDMLLGALASIRAQQWPSLETIVVDGGSTDGTIEALEAYGNVRVIKGPDGGVYDALNKGIAAASGDIVGFLNSDDSYEDNAFVAAARGFAQTPTADAVCGAAILTDNGRVVARFDRDADKTLTPRTALIGACIPNARFFRRAAAVQTGLFDIGYRLVSDRDWLMRWHEAGRTTAPLVETVYRYGRHPGSLTFHVGAAQSVEIRKELLHLARRWRDRETASIETRRIARLLEGRSVAALAMRAIKDRNPGESARWLVTEDNRWTLAPAFAAARSAVDWALQSRASHEDQCDLAAAKSGPLVAPERAAGA